MLIFFLDSFTNEVLISFVFRIPFSGLNVEVIFFFDSFTNEVFISFFFQKKIAEYGTILSQSVEQSKHHVRELMDELKHSTSEQKTMIFSIFDRVTKLQTLLLSEVSWLYTVLFYSGCLLAVYLATATKRTEDARLWLVAILSLNFFIERIICSWTLGSDEANIFEVYINEEQNPQAILYFRIWMSRKLAILAACLVLLVKALTFKDYNVINYELLQDIRKQNADLCQSVQFLKSFNTTKWVIRF